VLMDSSFDGPPVPIEPPVDDFLLELPVLADLLDGHTAALHQLVKR